MPEYNEKSRKESDLALAVATLLLNVLILAILCGGAWLLHSLFVQSNLGGAFLRGEHTRFR